MYAVQFCFSNNVEIYSCEESLLWHMAYLLYGKVEIMIMRGPS